MAKIMIVDDADFMRMAIRNNLTDNGYTDLVEAADGVEAIDKYCEHKPDVVFLDITMPKKDGIEVLEVIQNCDEHETRVVMCSSHGEESMIMKAIKLGAKDFIVKPFKPERIVQAVKNVLLN